MTGRVSDPAWREQVVGRLAGRFGRAAAVGAVARWSVSAVVRGLRGDLARLGLAGEVDVVFGTAELGVAKPDPAVFRLVCGRCGGGARAVRVRR